MRHHAALLLLLPLALPALADETPPCDEGHQVTPGLCVSAVGIAEGFSTVRGGLRQRSTGLLFGEVGAEADWNRLAGVEGWRTRISAVGILGRQHSETVTGNLAEISNVSGLSTARLFELWAERRWGELGSIRFGQLAADEEFGVADAAANLVNDTFGWFLGLSEALPSHGPAYPLASPAVRVNLGDPDDATGLRLAVFSGDPGGRRAPNTDGEKHNRFGTLFPFSGGALLMAELATGAAAPGGDAGHAPRPYVLELGGWWHTGRFEDQRRDAAGLLLSDPNSAGVPRSRRGNAGAYAMADATVWRAEWKPEASAVAVFARAAVTPGDRNLLGFYADAGLLFTNPFGRTGEAISLGAAHARVGRRARAADRDARAAALDAGQPPPPVRDAETILEANWTVSVVPDRLSVQPVVQWIRHPGAGRGDERDANGRAPRDALVLGLRGRIEL